MECVFKCGYFNPSISLDRSCGARSEDHFFITGQTVVVGNLGVDRDKRLIDLAQLYGGLRNRGLHNRLLLWFHNPTPSFNASQRLHPVEFTSGTHRVGSHASENEPIAHTQIHRQIDVLSQNVHAIAGHAEEGGISSDEVFGVLLDSVLLDQGVELVIAIFEIDSVHEDTVERMVQRIVNVNTVAAVLFSLGEHSGSEIASVGREVSSGFRHDGVPEGVVLGDLERVDGAVVEVVGGEAASEVEDLHSMAVFAADFEAFACEVHGLREAGRSVLAAAAVEVDAGELDAEVADLLEASVGRHRQDIITELARKCR